MENKTLDDIYDPNAISFLVLAGGKAKRLGGTPKLTTFLHGKNVLLEVIKDIYSTGTKSQTIAIIRKPFGDDIDGLLKTFNFYDKYNLRRVFYGKEADSKAFAIQEVTTQIVHAPLIAVLQGSVVYSKTIFKDFFRKLQEFNQKKNDNCGGMIYLATIDPSNPAPKFKTKYENANCQTCLEQICSEKTESFYQPAISVFDTKKLMALEKIPRYESKKERAGTTYLYERFVNEGYKFCIIKSGFSIAHLNTPKSIDSVRSRLDNKY